MNQEVSHIVIRRETRDKLKEAIIYRQSYDMVINDLLKFRQQFEEKKQLKEHHKKG